MKKIFAFSFMLVLCLSACKSDDPIEPTPGDVEPKPIVIEINSPSSGAALDLEIPVSIEIMITRENNGLISNAKIEILDITNAVLKTLLDDQIDRMGTYSYTNINGFMATSSGAYKIRVIASEANGLNEVTLIHQFTLE